MLDTDSRSFFTQIREKTFTFSAFIHYVNPFDRLGVRRYSFLFPFLGTLYIFLLLEISYYVFPGSSSWYGLLAIFVSIGLILYFAFRDGLKGGYTAVCLTIFYYLFIIFTHHYKTPEVISGLQTSAILGILYVSIAAIIGFLKQRIDILIGQEMDARILAQTKEKRLNTIMQQLPVGVFIVNKESKTVEGNEQLIKILGGENINPFLQKGSSFAVNKDKSLLSQQWPITKALIKGNIIKGEEMVYKRSDNKNVLLRINAAPIKDIHNKIIAAVSTVDDISKERAVEEERFRLATVVEFSEDAILSKTLEGIITSWNNGAEKLFGYSAKEIIGKSVNLIVPSSLTEEEKEIIRKLKNGKRIDHFETLRLKKMEKQLLFL